MKIQWTLLVSNFLTQFGFTERQRDHSSGVAKDDVQVEISEGAEKGGRLF